ncbi:MAG: hypothetical protein ACYC0Q_15400 [Eubacteriales bacterium]
MPTLKFDATPAATAEWYVQNRQWWERVKSGEEERELLKFLLSRGGFSRINAVTRRFGATEGDGFFWVEEEPASPLGLLWSRALVMVGKTVLNNSPPSPSNCARF